MSITQEQLDAVKIVVEDLKKIIGEVEKMIYRIENKTFLIAGTVISLPDTEINKIKNCYTDLKAQLKDKADELP